MDKYEPHKSSMGPDANIMALLAYLTAGILCFMSFASVFSFGPPLVFFLMEKESDFVKRHATQGVAVGASYAAVKIVMGIGAGMVNVFFGSGMLFGWSATWVVVAVAGLIDVMLWGIRICAIVVAVLGILKANNYEMYEVPVVGGLFRKWLLKEQQ